VFGLTSLVQPPSSNARAPTSARTAHHPRLPITDIMPDWILNRPPGYRTCG